jgi:hypothetical protein
MQARTFLGKQSVRHEYCAACLLKKREEIMTTLIIIPSVTHTPTKEPEAYANLLARFDALAAGVDMQLREIASGYQYHFSGNKSTVYAVTSCDEREPVQQLFFEDAGRVIELDATSLREHRVREALKTNPYCAQFGDRVPAMVSASITDVRCRLALHAFKDASKAKHRVYFEVG